MFDIERFQCDENISFYTGFPKYDTFVATYDFLNPGIEEENIRYCSSSERGIPDAFYDQLEGDDLETEQRNDKQGRRRKLKSIEEFFYGNVPPAKRVCFAASFTFIWSCNINCQPNLYCLG